MSMHEGNIIVLNMPPIWPRFAGDSSDFAYQPAMSADWQFSSARKRWPPQVCVMRDARMRSAVCACVLACRALITRSTYASHSRVHTRTLSTHVFGLVPVSERTRVTPIRENMSVSTSSETLPHELHTIPEIHLFGNNNPRHAYAMPEHACARFSSEMFADQMGERVCQCVCAWWPPYHRTHATETHTKCDRGGDTRPHGTLLNVCFGYHHQPHRN